jgi:phosphoribosyl-ATP pyrophosphohydrolase
MSDATLGDVLTRLAATIEARKGGSSTESYTASLLAQGPAACAKKLGEEALELALAAAAESDERVAAEAADLIYHLLVVLSVRNVGLDAVAAELVQRQGRSGHSEKAARKRD